MLLAALAVGCVRPTPPEVAPHVPRPELWVDAFSPAGGDGTAARPLRTLPQELPKGTTVHVRSGVYPGPFRCDGATVIGHGEVVLTGDTSETTVVARGCGLEALSVQGGQRGVLAEAGTSLTRVRFSGQRRLAAELVGPATLADVTLVASVEGIDGLLVRGRGLAAAGLTFEGGFRRALALQQAEGVVRRVRAEGARTAVHALDSTLELEGVTASAGSGPALFFAGGKTTLRDVAVQGHEYGLQVGRAAELHARGVRVRGTAQACVSAVQATVTLEALDLARCGLGAGLELLDSRTTLDGLELDGTPDLGVLVREGAATIRHAHIAHVSRSGEALGDAIHVRSCVARIDDARVTDVAGSALFASAGAEVSVGGLEVERAGDVSLFVERASTVKLERVLVRGGGGPALLVPDRARVELGALSVAGGNEAPIYAECAQGAVVLVGRLESTIPQVTSRCVLPLPK
ncbi:MAG: hypothetical protein ACOZQL_00520 [Myxococcota bacterium]